MRWHIHQNWRQTCSARRSRWAEDMSWRGWGEWGDGGEAVILEIDEETDGEDDEDEDREEEEEEDVGREEWWVRRDGEEKVVSSTIWQLGAEAEAEAEAQVEAEASWARAWMTKLIVCGKGAITKWCSRYLVDVV
ncbi:hypothetical protein CDD82_2234 [Ophiocordyceps australis]|uniref:Uncharacterized protein n=1 Tax=Ophiocordyceps australis TaxID=1399860 RepID=A0A2C5ZI39_9HYPO|nr:hypothetical protein CDD82_2234 [Ophiocordyceps australis]